MIIIIIIIIIITIIIIFFLVSVPASFTIIRDRKVYKPHVQHGRKTRRHYFVPQ
jgi:hypothetical protein